MTAKATNGRAEFSAEAELNEQDREMNDRIARWGHLEEYFAEQSVHMRREGNRLLRKADVAKRFRHPEHPEIDEHITQLIMDAFECFREAEQCGAELAMLRADLQCAEVC